MADKPGFFRRIFSFGSAPEDARVPPQGEAPRPSDTLAGTTPGAPDPDSHQVAAADTVADSEAGAAPGDGGRIEPLVSRDASSGGVEASAPQPGTAEKKTSATSRSRWNG